MFLFTLSNDDHKAIFLLPISKVSSQEKDILIPNFQITNLSVYNY